MKNGRFLVAREMSHDVQLLVSYVALLFYLQISSLITETARDALKPVSAFCTKKQIQMRIGVYHWDM